MPSKHKSITKNGILDMAVDTATFGIGVSILDSASGSFQNNSAAKGIVNAAGTLYAAKMLQRVAGNNKKGFL